MKKCAIIIGVGPTGLTAAYELIAKTDIQLIIIEKTNNICRISKTVLHDGNRMDIGEHRFFSKSDVVMQWWLDILPMQGSEQGNQGENKCLSPKVLILREQKRSCWCRMQREHQP